MAVMVALLRGVNVGGKNKLAMADLRRTATDCGCEQAQTYIQSGNLVFSTAEKNPETVAERLRRAIADTTNVRPDVVVRSRDELASVVADNPYRKRGEDTAHLHVIFLSGTGKADLGALDTAPYAPDEVTAVGRELYLFLPNGLGKSKLAADLARRKGPSGTARNWRTVTKLLAMADELS